MDGNDAALEQLGTLLKQTAPDGPLDDPVRDEAGVLTR
jgi:hypothetical protein